MGGTAGLLGALICVLLGLLAAARVKERETCVRCWEQGLIRMENAVRRGGLPLPELLEEGSVEALDQAAGLLRKEPGLGAAALCARLPKGQALTDPEWQAAQSMISGLFAPDLAGQLAALQYAREQFAHFSQLCREAGEKNIRLYQSLGWLSGAAIFILLC